MKDNKRIEETKDHIRHTCSQLEKFGITYFSYGLIVNESVLISIFSHEEWGKLYKENRYDRVDPLLRGVMCSNFPLIIWDALHPCGRERQIMMERNKICGIKSGLTIGVRNKDNKEIFALGADMSPEKFYGLLNNEAYLKEIYNIIGSLYFSKARPS